jgi:hypothetical protein
LAYGQAPAATIVETGVPPKVSYAIHNDSSVTITAWIVMSKSARTGARYEISEGFASAKGGVAPGAQADVEFGKIVTALFADGSIWGDTEWAKLFQLRRQYQFEVLGDAIADLEAAARVPGPDLAVRMDAVRKRRKRVATDLANLAAQGGTQDLFEEKTTEQKAAHVQQLAIEWRVLATDMAYGDIVHSLEARPPEKGGNVPEAERIQRLLDKFNHTRDQLVAAQPELRLQSR